MASPAQRVLQSPPRFERIKLKPCPADKRAAIIRREALKLAQHAFDLAGEPPLRVALLSFDRTNHALVVNVHHLVTDGWSQRLFWEELAAHYAAAQKRSTAGLPPPAFQYRDFALWQQSWALTPAARSNSTIGGPSSTASPRCRCEPTGRGRRSGAATAPVTISNSPRLCRPTCGR